VQKIFSYTKEYDLEEATGTFINRNHFAGLLEMILPFALAAAFYAFQRWGERPQAPRGRRAGPGDNSAIFQAVFYASLVLVMAVGVIFSLSRGGILAVGISLVCVSLIGQLRAARKGWILLVIFFLASLVGYGLWIGLDPALVRFEQMRNQSFVQMEARAAIWKDTLKLARAYPLTGSGYGTYGLAFRRYQTELVTNYVDHAHNDYLEYASETGLPGAALVFLPALYLLAKLIVSFLSDTRRFRRLVTLGCMGAILAMLVHSFMDFNLAIPANALCFAVILGIGYKAACLERREEAQAALRPAEFATPVGRVARPV